MPPKSDPVRRDHAVRLYVSGQTVHQAAAEAGIGATTLSRELHARGIEARSRRTVLPEAELVQRYRAGESELALATAYGVDRNTLRKRLTEHGVEIRGRSAAGYQRYVGSTESERRALTEAAHTAVRGSTVPEAALARRALAVQQRADECPDEFDSVHEMRLCAWLDDRRASYVRQQAVGPYNVDVAMAPVAVEVLGGEWHLFGNKAEINRRRTPYLFDQGWHVVFVWSTTNYPISTAAAEQVIALVDQLRRDPSPIRQYRVVRGDGQLLAAGGPKEYQRSGIAPARQRLDPGS